MTTIVADARRGVMCADSCWTDGINTGPMRKVFRVRGELVGLAGDVGDLERWLALWRGDPIALVNRRPRLPDVNVLLLNDQGLHTWDNTNTWVSVAAKRHAIGSGRDYALGALDAGASARRAAEIACAHDALSKGPVRTYRLR